MLINKKTGILALLLLALLASANVMADETHANQSTCPVMGGPINKEVYADYNGERVYFCCEACIKTFKESPEPYLKKMKDAGVVLEKAPITQTKCPVSGQAIDPKIHTDHNGQRVYFCCNGCKAKFEKNPEQFPTK